VGGSASGPIGRRLPRLFLRLHLMDSFAFRVPGGLPCVGRGVSALDGLLGTKDHGLEMTALPLVGRERELAALADLIDLVSERGRALVVRGEAGIGKSTLLAAATTRARDHGMLVLTATGVQSEAHLPFAGLHQLLRPILSGSRQLPDPQRGRCWLPSG
jgi:hypothetical protein